MKNSLHLEGTASEPIWLMADGEEAAMRRMFNRSADEIEHCKAALSRADLRHKLLFKKFGQRLQELRGGAGTGAEEK